MRVEDGATDLWVLGHRVRLLTANGQISAMEVTVTPGMPGPPPHRHLDAAEYFYVLEGSLEVMVDGEWLALSAGGTSVVPAGALHTFRLVGGTPARFITGWEPHGFEQFFLDAGVPVDEPEAFERSVSEDQLAVAIESLSRLAEVAPPAPAATG